MEQPRYKETCDKLFAVLGYSDEEKTEALGALKELHEKIHALRSADELAQASHAFFKAILEEYAGFMSDGLDAARAHELRKIASSF